MSAEVHKQFLFEARTRGYHVFRIPGLVVTRAGSVLAWGEARKGKGGDWDPIDICMRRSTDGGDTWSEPYLAMDHTRFSADMPTNNFVCTADLQTGEVHVLFSVNYARVFSMKSTDDGRSFTDPVEVTRVFESFRSTYPWRVVACGPGHGLQARSGRLIVPVWMSTGAGTEFGTGKLGHRPSVVAVVYSDDHGATWKPGDFVFPDEYPFRNPSETVAVELSDGRILLNARTESYSHRRAVSVSSDGVAGWSTPEFDYRLVDPICMASIIGLDLPTRAIVFANPAVLERTMKGGPGDRGVMPEELGKPFDRKHLGIRLSEDDCRNWRWSRRLEDGPSGYSDLAVLPDGTILCFYECGIVERMYDDRGLCLARFTVDWIKEGREAR
jgi:sialidase-1